MSIYDKSSLVLIPSGTKAGKVYSQKPTNGDGDFTFTRSSAATRVNADGNIEKETQNLLTYSNTFSNAAWIKLGAGSGTAASVTSGFSDPDGGSNAWRLQCDLNGGSLTTDQSLIYQAGGLTGVFAFSYYVKSNTGASQDFAFGNSLNGYKLATATTSWQRFTTFHNCTSNNNSFIGARGGLNTDDTLDILIYASQVEYGLVARDYIETTTSAVYGGITDNVPRLDYTDSSCPSLKLEPQRSNLVPFSEHLESSDWSKTRCTIEDNSTTSPEGVINASKMTSTDASESYIQDNLTTTGTKLTWSFFAKKGDLDYAHGLVWDLSANGCRQWFNLSTGAVGGTTTFGSGYSVDSATIEDYGNGWYRCVMVVNSTAGAQGCRVNISSADTTIGSAVNSYGYFYGLQGEDASYATSYIPTYGSSVSRVAETNHLFDVDNNSIISDSTNFTAYFELEILGSDNPVDKIRITDSSGSPRIYLYKTTAGVTSWSNVEGLPTGSIVKFAFRADSATSISFYENGAKTETFTDSGSNPLTIDRLLMYGANGAFRVHQVALFNSRLTDQEAIDLTTL